MVTIIENNESCDLKTARSETMRSPKTGSAKTMLCRICFDSETDADILIRPCACNGTVAFVHNACLERWVRATSNIQCTICQSEFELIPAGLKDWKDISFPRPLSDLPEDYMEFGCTVAWMVYMLRFVYVGLRYGSRSMIENVDSAIGTGTLRSLWWLSFWFNFLYYGAMSFVFYEKWLLDNTIFKFKDRCDDQYSQRSVAEPSLTKSQRKKLRN
ncbi:hypothetical protein GCK72_005481 [Caenorhabditis remanei]|uniref:Uncharacterized protein n=1 Tax=Caenorhabditis remanei TaxID=31234 RepID=A0A6A5HEK7_CAERE|nr:hypothetical protein GCK72_005481 [Caenorhabditis remanei]KAF1765529.1 hypothetical protein GCK72_005481 [Caenorhabditis remanei]